MKKSILVFTLTLTSLIFVNAQDQELFQGQLNGGGRVSGLISTTPIIENETIEGSPYVNEKFLPAKISASENNIFYVRYNALKDEFEVKGENDIAYALNKYRRDIIVEVIGLKKTYQVFGYLDEDGTERSGYFVDMSEQSSNIKLLKKENVKFVKQKTAVTSYDSARPAQYKRSDDNYFIKIEGNNAIELPTNKKDIARLFPKHEDDILSFIKENKIKTKKEENLKKLIIYINELS